MKLFDKEGNELPSKNFTQSELKSRKAKFFENNRNELLKQFIINDIFVKRIGDYVITPSVFEDIKDMNNKNIVELLNYYYYFDEVHSRFDQIDAYTMKKIDIKDVDLLSEDKTALSFYVSDLEKLAEDLANKKIVIQNINGGNIVFNNDGPVLLDVDLYYRNALNFKSNISAMNKKILLFYLANYAINCYQDNYEDKTVEDHLLNVNNIYSLFSIKPTKSIAKEFNKNIDTKENTIAKQLKLQPKRNN